jgi:hypothetical protein
MTTNRWIGVERKAEFESTYFDVVLILNVNKMSTMTSTQHADNSCSQRFVFVLFINTF